MYVYIYIYTYNIKYNYISYIYIYIIGDHDGEHLIHENADDYHKKIKSLSQDNAEQTSTSLQPSLCTKPNRVNKQYFLEFNASQQMISNIDLNPAAGEDDIINVFIIYKITSFGVIYWTPRGLYGHDDHGFDTFISFSPSGDLVVSSTTNDHIVIGQNITNGRTPITDYKTKANTGELNKWICLSVHWNLRSKISYVYCNGKKLCNFNAHTSMKST